MRGFSLFAAVFAAFTLLSPTKALAKDIELPEAVYEPDGKWRLGSSEKLCWLRRDFSRGDDTVTFVIQLADPGADPQWGLFGENVGGILRPITAGFTPGLGTQRKIELAHASLGSLPGVVFAGPVFPTPRFTGSNRAAIKEHHAGEAERLNRVTHFVVSGATPGKIALHTHALGKAMAALKGCSSDKLVELGVDPARYETYTQRAVPYQTALWAKRIQDDYPLEALATFSSGSVPLRVIIAPNGRPTDCQALNEVAARVLREAACRNMLRYSRWTGARDENGKPAIGYYNITIQYAGAASQLSPQ